MFFEAPAGTRAHQDSYDPDSAARLGGCIAGWFAPEDIDAGAGRFYVCPGSHSSLVAAPRDQLFPIVPDEVTAPAAGAAPVCVDLASRMAFSSAPTSTA